MAFWARVCDQCHTSRALCDALQSTSAHVLQEELIGQLEEFELYSSKSHQKLMSLRDVTISFQWFCFVKIKQRGLPCLTVLHVLMDYSSKEHMHMKK